MSTVAAAAQIISTALSVLNTVRERAKTSKDTALKNHISELYDNLLALKEAVMRITDENNELRNKIAQLTERREPELRQVGSANYYFDGDKGPCCQVCYDRERKLTVLTQPEDWNGGVRRQCLLCSEFFYEKPMAHERGNSRGGSGGPHDWMAR
jgi:hypothetical protein